MNPQVIKYLEDIYLSIEIIELHISGIKSLQQYQNDLKTIDAIERRLGIIGEALYKANKIDDSLSITTKGKIIGLRHILVHDYNLIDIPTIWLIIQKNLPVLKMEIGRFLNK